MAPFKDWTTNFPATQDTGTNGTDQQPDLIDKPTAIPNPDPPTQGDNVRASQFQALRNKTHALATVVGDDTLAPAGSLRERMPHALQDDDTGQIGAIASKASPVAADVVLLESIADGDALRSATVGSLVAYAVPGYQLSSYADLPTALADIGAAEATLTIDAADTLASNVTVPANVTLAWIRGFVLTVNNTYTLTINGDIEASRYQIFDTSAGGVVDLPDGGLSLDGTPIDDIYPEWWGCTYGGDCTAALQAAVNAAGKSRRVLLAGAVYGITAKISMYEYIYFEGMPNATIRALGVIADWMVEVLQNSYITQVISFQRIRLDGNSLAQDGIRFYGISSGTRGIKNVYVQGVTGDGIHFDSMQVSAIYDCGAYQCGGYGIKITDSNGSKYYGLSASICGGYGIWLQSAGGGSGSTGLYSPHVEATGSHGIYVHTVSGMHHIHNVWIESCDGHGVSVVEGGMIKITGGKIIAGSGGGHRWLHAGDTGALIVEDIFKAGDGTEWDDPLSEGGIIQIDGVYQATGHQYHNEHVKIITPERLGAEVFYNPDAELTVGSPWAGSGFTLGSSTATVHSGTYSFEVPDGGYGLMWQYYRNLRPHQLYKFTSWVYPKFTGDGGMRLIIYGDGAAGYLLTNDYIVGTGRIEHPDLASGSASFAFRDVVAAWQVDADGGPSYVDMETECNDAVNANVVPFPTTEAVGDYFAIALGQKSRQVTFHYANGTAGINGGSLAVVWEYLADDDIWKALSNVVDDTAGFTTAAADYLAVTYDIPADWARKKISTDAFNAFYVRCRITAGSYSTNPVLDAVDWAAGKLTARTWTKLEGYFLAPGDGGTSRPGVQVTGTLSGLDTGWFVDDLSLKPVLERPRWAAKQIDGAWRSEEITPGEVVEYASEQVLLPDEGRFVSPQSLGLINAPTGHDHSTEIQLADDYAVQRGIPLRFLAMSGYSQIATSFTLDATVVEFESGAALYLNSTYTVTLLGEVKAPKEWIFNVDPGGRPSFIGSKTSRLFASWFGPVGDGVSTGDISKISVADDVADAASKPLVISAGTYISNGDYTYEADLEFEEGALLQPSSGDTVTINGDIAAGNYQIFDLSGGGSIVFGVNGTSAINPKWFGATGDGTTDDATAINNADAAAASAGLSLLFPVGTYRFSSSQTLTATLLLREGAMLEIDNTYTLTLDGLVEGGAYQIFDTSAGGSIDFATSDQRVLEGAWWLNCAEACPAAGSTLPTEITVRCNAALSANYTVLSNIVLNFIEDSVVTLSSGVTLTLNGVIKAPSRQVFDTSAGGGSSVVFGNGSPYADPKWWGATGDGTTDDSSAVVEADTAAAAAGIPLTFPTGTYRFSSSQTLISQLVLPIGSVLEVDNTYTVTLSGDIESANYQIFDISAGGSIAFGSNGVRAVNPKWFGATGDGSTDDSTEIDAADVAAANAGVALEVTPGDYVIGSSQTLTALIRMLPGAVFNISDTFTLTLNEIEAGPYAIFDTNTSGTVTLNDVSHERYDEWFDDGTPWSSKRIGSHGEAYEVRTVKTELTALSGATATWSNAIPAGSEVLGVSARVTTLITGATTFDIGDGTDVDRWGAAIVLTAGTTTDLSDMTDFTRQVYSAATSIVLTANGSNFTAGAVRLVLHYRLLTAPTS